MNDRQQDMLAVFNDADVRPDRPEYPYIAFVRRLLGTRDLADDHFFLSHTILSLGPAPAGESGYRPSLRVMGDNKGKIVLKLWHVETVAPIYRSHSEQVICDPEQALGEFDRLYVRYGTLKALSPAGEG